MMNQNLPNGVPPQFNTMKHVPSQDKPVNPYNGLGSVHSSRDSSPVTRFQQIPPYQLPPNKTGIPASQLPPSRSRNINVSHITQKYSHMNVSGISDNEITPFSSPAVQTFNTSTPNESCALQNLLKPSVSNFIPSVISPTSTTAISENKQPTTVTQSFTHSATSQFTNVIHNIPESNRDLHNQNKVSENIVKNMPVVMSPHMVDVCLDKNKPQEVLSDSKEVKTGTQLMDNEHMIQPVENLQKPFNMNVFTNQSHFKQNLTRQDPKPLTLQSETYKHITIPNTHQVKQQEGSFQEHNLSHTAQTLNINLNKEQVNHTSKNIPPVNHPLSGVPVNSNQSQSIATSGLNIQTRTPLQSASNSPHFQNKPNFIQNMPQMNNSPAIQSVLPIISQSPVTINTFSNRPIFQSTSSQAKPNTSSVASSNYFQPQQIANNSPLNQYPQSSQNSSSLPNLIQKQVPPPSNILPGQTLVSYTSPNISTSTFQTTPIKIIEAVTPSQMRPHMHSNRYPMQQPPVSHVTTQQQQQLYQGTSTNLNAQQYIYANKPESQQQLYQPNVYQNQQVTKNQFQNYNKNLSVTQVGFNKLWGMENYDLLQNPNILPPTKLEPPNITLGQDFLDSVNCSPDIFRCTMTKIPETSSLLHKSRLPLGVLIHPFKDLNHLPVIQCNTIVRCRACRTYINPFIFFVDTKRWKCNLCYRVNELPEDFQYDPVTKTYGDPSKRPEVKASTIEFIAPAEYMLRPPQPAVYLFLLDVSRLAIESGYLHTVCNVLSSELTNLPGDARTHIGFLAYDSALHFYSLSEGQNQPHEMTIVDVDDVFLPCPDNLLVNLQDRMELVSDLLVQLPTRYNNNYDTGSALGPALQIAYKMMASTGGRVTVFQAVLPNVGPGSLSPREDPNQRASAEISHLNPANDFYKRLALECSGQQIAVDLFILNSQYVDLATISGISRFSGGCIHHFPLFKASRTLQNESLEQCFRRYVTRKIGFEAVMRIRCTRGLSIHTFHGNFFVRSTDLLSLPNINPDAGFGMQVSIEENLSDVQTVCFQAALLYTSSKGERRIRVHTMCLPVASTLTDILNSADQQCIVGLLSKMAVDRSMQSSLSDAREAFLNVAIDILSSYKISLNMANGQHGLMAPQCLKLLPLYISALLKSVAFRIGTSTRLDDRVKAMCDMKSKPLPYLIQQIYPDLYPVHNLEEQTTVLNEDEEHVHVPPHLQLTARNIDSNGAYLLDMGEHMVLFICSAISPVFLNHVLGIDNFTSINEEMYEIPTLNNLYNQKFQMFINYLNDERPFPATVQIMGENSPNRGVFLERLIEDRMENSLSYHEFLQHIKTQVK